MKRKICIITLLFACCLTYGQTYLRDANACFEKGDYDCAVRNYSAHQKISTDDVSAQIKKSEECYKLRLTADGYFEAKDYDKASVQYDKILKINPKDASAKKQYDLCRAQLPAQSQIFERAHPQETGVVINGLRWATRNVGAKGTFVSSPEEYGNYYTFDEAQTACPKSWRVPTFEELESLANANSSWTTVNGVEGRTFGNGNNKIFLPAAGNRHHGNGQLDGPGVAGGYWSATAYGDFSYSLDFNSGTVIPANFYNRANGFSVRCIIE